MQWIAPTLAVALSATSIGSGMQTEDYVHRALAQSSWSSVFTMFGDPAASPWTTYRAKAVGALPWITSDEWRVAFFRPVTALTHMLDYRAWPDTPWLMHLHTLVWLFVLVHFAARLLRALSPSPAAAGLGATLYAVNEGHGLAIGWLANRSMVVATALSFAALYAFHLGQSRKSWMLRVGSGVLLLLALGAGELAVGVLAFFLSYFFFIDVGPWKRRFISCAPILAALAIWLSSYVGLGYGTHGSGVYIHPIDQPGAFFAAAVFRGPVLVFGLLGFAPVEAIPMLPVSWAWPLFGLGCAWFVAIAHLAIQLLRDDARYRFWLFAALVALIPACTTGPSERLLFIADVGAAAIIASIVVRAFLKRGPRLARAVSVVWLFSGVVLAAPALAFRAQGLAPIDEGVDTLARDVARDVRSDQHLILVNAHDFYTGALTMVASVPHMADPPSHVHVLYGGVETITVARTTPNTLRVCAPSGFLSSPLNRVYRSPTDPFREGDGLQLVGFRYIVITVDESGNPLCADFYFHAIINSDRYRFMVWKGHGYDDFTPPPLGSSVEVSPGQLLKEDWAW